MINRLVKYIILISFTSLSFGIIGSLLTNYAFSDTIEYSYYVFVLASLILLIGNGDFIKTREYQLSKFGIPLIIVGVLFRMMDWRYADLLIGLGYLGLVLFYIIYLIRHKKSHWLYTIKLLFLICFLGAKFFSLIHFVLAREIEITSLSLLIFLVVVYFLEEKLLSPRA